MKKFFTFFLLCSVFAYAGNPADAEAFWKKKKKKRTPAAPVQKVKSVGPVRIFERPEYMVLFSIYPIGGEKNSWSEIGYKLVDRTEERGKLFGATGWVEIRFQDKEGFNLIAAPVHFENPKTEYYGFVRVENAKASQIARIDLQPLKESEVPKEPAPVQSPAPAQSPSQAPAPVQSPSQAPAPVSASAQPEPESSPEPSKAPAAAPSPQAPAWASSPEPAEPMIPSGVITNEVIQKTFEELDKKAAPPAENTDPAAAAPKVNTQ